MRASSSREDVLTALEQGGAEEKRAGPDGAAGGGMVNYKTYDGIEDVESSESEDEVERRAREEGAYHDDLMFDSIKEYLPSGKEGRHVLLAFILCQCAMVALLFIGFHHRDTEFECCNMYAVAVALLFIVVQLFYYADWVAIDGDNPAWHRANLFVPAGVFLVIFFEWTVGTGGMLAHAIDIDLFGPSFSDLDTFSKVAFVVDSALGAAVVPLLFAMGYVHRNNLGQYYYVRDERPDQHVELLDYPTPAQGSFHLRSWVKRTARVLGVDTSRGANENLPRVITLATALQVPFYAFAAATYANGNQSNLPIIFLSLGAIYCLLSVQYSIEATSSRKKRTRKWNRQHLFFPMAGLLIGLGAYMFTMSSVFFKSAGDEGTELWEDIISNLDTTEILTFIVTSGLLFVSFVLAAVLCILHRKGWCDGQRDLEFMIEMLERQEEEERQRQAKRQAYLRRMGLIDEAGAPTAEAVEARKAQEAARAKGAVVPSAAAGAAGSGAAAGARTPRSAMRKKPKAADSAEPSEVSVSISQSPSGRVTRESNKRIVPVDEQFGGIDEGSESEASDSSSDGNASGANASPRGRKKVARQKRPTRARVDSDAVHVDDGDLDESD